MTPIAHGFSRGDGLEPYGYLLERGESHGIGTSGDNRTSPRYAERMKGLRTRAALAALALGSCSAPPTPPRTPVTVVAVAPAAAAPAAVTPTAREPSPAGRDARLTVDGVDLGSPVGALLAREAYAHPCDVDPIDHRASSLYFFAAGPCRDAPPFPGETSVILVTTRNASEARGAQPLTLFAWAGSYFDDRTQLGVRMGDSAARVTQVLGAPNRTSVFMEMKSGVGTRSTTLSWDRVHVLLVDDHVAVLAIGDLGTDVPFDAVTMEPSERAQTLERLHRAHLRYRPAKERP
jgi:hypothetical protein